MMLILLVSMLQSVFLFYNISVWKHSTFIAWKIRALMPFVCVNFLKTILHSNHLHNLYNFMSPKTLPPNFVDLNKLQRCEPFKTIL